MRIDNDHSVMLMSKPPKPKTRYRLQNGLNVVYGSTMEEAYYKLLCITPYMLRNEQNKKFFDRFAASHK